MTVHPLRLALVVRSAEPGRFATTVAAWFGRVVERRDDFKLDLVDLATTPLIDLPARIAEADGVVVLTPEYNHAYPGELKTAIDAVREPWYAKPVAFIVYGGRSRGLRAAEQLRLVFGELHAVTLRETLSFHQVPGCFTDDGEPTELGTAEAATALLDQLAWWARALRDARTTTPYPG
ncbi:NADPH-dependent FMN reductase [Kribbella flavida DSM 17836]|uniref:NADPH-dependent FMN reductase n=1 Tax=Kribbella flavida (strain DSM 17836 / JCM 10339 / NBRC 14399) TaxID=479435 RepID=D2Q3Q2_KRIFD|nr:NAD(P)H-dependent oxidoreductase [Kribbella flavida]ADB35924.1 NADPH-dependent FMN reductase [Kribbella flavida DSM 17836]